MLLALGSDRQDVLAHDVEAAYLALPAIAFIITLRFMPSPVDSGTPQACSNFACDFGSSTRW